MLGSTEKKLEQNTRLFYGRAACRKNELCQPQKGGQADPLLNCSLCCYIMVCLCYLTPVLQRTAWLSWMCVFCAGRQQRGSHGGRGLGGVRLPSAAQWSAQPEGHLLHWYKTQPLLLFQILFQALFSCWEEHHYPPAWKHSGTRIGYKLCVMYSLKHPFTSSFVLPFIFFCSIVIMQKEEVPVCVEIKMENTLPCR